VRETEIGYRLQAYTIPRQFASHFLGKFWLRYEFLYMLYSKSDFQKALSAKSTNCSDLA
jgi:hypothetical protein